MHPDAVLFFDRAPALLPLFDRLHALVLQRFPGATVTVQKTQITFLDPRGFCFVSLRGGRYRGCLMVTVGLLAPPQCARVAEVSHPTARRCTCHIPVRTPDEVDGELMRLIEQSHAVMALGRLRG